MAKKNKIASLAAIGILLASLAIGILLASLLAGCTEAAKVSQNISNEADNFNVCRRITMINLRTDSVLYEFEGFCSITTDNEDQQLEITSEVGDGVYKKDFIRLSNETTYVVQDISGADVDKYHYEWSVLPTGIKFTTDEK